jgi:hypothetical protein
MQYFTFPEVHIQFENNAPVFAFEVVEGLDQGCRAVNSGPQASS